MSENINVSPGIAIKISVSTNTDGLVAKEYVDKQIAALVGSVEDAQSAASVAGNSAASAARSAGAAAEMAEEAVNKAASAQAAAETAVSSARSAQEAANAAESAAASANNVLESIPEDYSDLSEEVDKLSEEIGEFAVTENPDSLNIIDWDKIVHRTYVEKASTTANDGYWNTGFRAVAPNTSYVCSQFGTAAYMTRVNFYANDKTPIGSITNVREFVAPENCAYIILAQRYRHNGVVGTYTDVDGWDDCIGNMVINAGTADAVVTPTPEYWSKEVRRDVSVSGRVVHVDDAKPETAQITIARNAYSGTIDICVCGSNIFDGELLDGYYSDGVVVPNTTHKCSKNPIYVNANGYVTFSKDVRVTEHAADGRIIRAELATGRVPYKVSPDVSYVHIHGTNDDMAAMYINIGKRMTNAAEAYVCAVVQHDVRTWGPSKYSFNIKMRDGENTVFVKNAAIADITLTYNAYETQSLDKPIRNAVAIDGMRDYRGIKLAGSEMYIAHRGGNEAPENTYAAYLSAFEHGFKALESDVRFTSDNVPMMLHDATIDRTSNGTGEIASMTAEEVSQYDFGSWKSKKYTGERIPSFNNFIKICYLLNMIPLIDIGGHGNNLTDVQIKILFDVVEKYGMTGCAVWCIGHWDTLRQILARYEGRAEGCRFAYTTTAATDISSVIASAGWFFNSSGLNIAEARVSIPYASVTSSLIEECEAVGVKAQVYTFNDVRTAIGLARYKIDAFVTDSLDVPIALMAHYTTVDFYN